MQLPGKPGVMAMQLRVDELGVPAMSVTAFVQIPFKLANAASVWQVMCLAGFAYLWRTRTKLAVNDPWTDSKAGPTGPTTARKILCATLTVFTRVLSAQIAPADAHLADRLRRLVHKLRGAQDEAAGHPTATRPAPS